MSQRAFSLVVSESGSSLHLQLLGELDRSSAWQVEAALARIEEPGAPREVVIDLRELTFLDLDGLRAILRVNDRGRAEGFSVKVIRPRGSASRLFTLTPVGRELDLVDEAQAA